MSLMLLKGRQDFFDLHLYWRSPESKDSRGLSHVSGPLITHLNFNLKRGHTLIGTWSKATLALLVHPGVMNPTSISLPARREVHT